MKKINFILTVSFIVSCSSIPPLIDNNRNEIKPKDIMVFLDGTANTPESNTNIFKLYNLKQRRENISSFYTVGVGGGPDYKILGMGMGTGIGRDVRDAYKFICENYQKNRSDKLHIFGYSRGGYAALILSNLMYVTGIINLDNIKEEKIKEKFIAEIYRAYRGKKSFVIRKKHVKEVIRKFERKNNVKITVQKKIFVETLNLIDVVEALSAPDFKDKRYCAPNTKHLSQLVNVKNVLHAVSLDDNRARIFTPILQTCDEIQTDRNLNTFVNEVWFAGAHADVGGGYEGQDNLQNLSLNWMLHQLKDKNLFTHFELNKDHIKGEIHSAETHSFWFNFIYRKRDRDIQMFINPKYNNGKLKIHNSVFKRLKAMKYHNNKLSRKHFWFDSPKFKDCFETKNDSLRIFKGNCKYIEVVNDAMTVRKLK